jgi:hypothetical protein
MAHLVDTTPSSSCNGVNCAVREGINASGIDLILSVAALALLAPVLIFISTATRLSAARREQRFAAIRLVGATPRQISLIAAVEVLALFVTTVAVALITTENVKRPGSVGGPAAANALSDQFIAGHGPGLASAPPPPATLLARLRGIRGSRASWRSARIPG